MVEFFYYVRSLEMKKPNKLGKVKKGISDLLGCVLKLKIVQYLIF